MHGAALGAGGTRHRTHLRPDHRSQRLRRRQVYRANLRRIRYRHPETGKNLVFLTNQFALPALTICALYRCRWQVELFFKWIKQHLRIKRFYGTSENAVRTQIWNVCLLMLVHFRGSHAHYYPRLCDRHRGSRNDCGRAWRLFILADATMPRVPLRYYAIAIGMIWGGLSNKRKACARPTSGRCDPDVRARSSWQSRQHRAGTKPHQAGWAEHALLAGVPRTTT